MSKLYVAHQSGDKNAGLNIESEGGAGVVDTMSVNLVDLYLTRYWGLKLATGAATTVLKVDQVRDVVQHH